MPKTPDPTRVKALDHLVAAYHQTQTFLDLVGNDYADNGRDPNGQNYPWDVLEAQLYLEVDLAFDSASDALRQVAHAALEDALQSKKSFSKAYADL